MDHPEVALLEVIIRSLVDRPDDVNVERIIDERGVLLRLFIDPLDLGKVIGREGNTAKAIRTILRVVGMKNNAHINLKIMEPAVPVFGSAEPGTESA